MVPIRLLVQSQTYTLEIVNIAKYIVPGFCMTYVQDINYLDSYNCTTFDDGCPDTFYHSDETYKCKFL